MELKSQNKLFNHFFIVMSRRSNAKKKIGKPNPIYHNKSINILVNRIFRHGKKSFSYQIFYKLMKNIKQRMKKNPYLFCIKPYVG
jgi:small subunit ribosomal protein S7